MAVHLNFKHLHYFWMVATHGSVSAAAQAAHLTPQTVSGQLKLLEEAIGVELFEKTGRRLVLSEAGRMVLAYADEMFRLGDELKGVLEGRLPGAPRVLVVGVAMVWCPSWSPTTSWSPPCAWASPCGWCARRPPRRTCWRSWRCTSWTWCSPTARSAQPGGGRHHRGSA